MSAGHTSDNLALIQIVESQNDKETTINDQAAQLDAALTEVLTIQVDDTNAYVLTADQLRRHSPCRQGTPTTPPWVCPPAGA